MTVDHARLKLVARDLLEAIGEDPEREGLQDTPRRFADLWREFIDYEPGSTDTAFASNRSSQLVVVSGMRVWSLCEHHLLPFWCDVSIAYVPNGQVLGLSKFARIAHDAAHRLQLQERVVSDVANRVIQVTRTEDVAVLARGEHLCMTMRGVKTPATMSSTDFRGAFSRIAELRAEFLALAR